MKSAQLRNLAFNCLLDLSTDEGINASGKDDIYGCIFGRDSALTVLKMLKVQQNKPSLKLLTICKKALLSLISLQGTEFNLESGEQPGKFIHEFRRDKYEHLLKLEKPWFVYPDKTLRNYDSIDSTPLTLIAIYKYWQATKDGKFLISSLDAVEKGLNWIITFGDSDKDFLIEYELPKQRKHGGLVVQSWTDSNESLTDQFGNFPKYPIAPVEAQGYAWLALKLWGNFYQDKSPHFSQKLLSQADKLKENFNKLFIFESQNLYYAAQALDGNKNLIKTVTGNPLLLLWASYQDKNYIECILDDAYIPDLVKRAFKKDLFDSDAGIRTMSTDSPTYNPTQNSYHNGSFWPILNGLIHEGLINWGFLNEAKLLKQASLKPLEFFQTPIELYTKDPQTGQFLEYKNPQGQVSCKEQAWSAAAMLDLLTEKNTQSKLLFPILKLWQHTFIDITPFISPKS